MIEPILAAVAAAPTGPGATASPPKSKPDAPTTDATTASAQAATRVYVDRSDSGVYVYRLVDVPTGRVLAELPRAASGALKVSADYTPGAMASQTV